MSKTMKAIGLAKGEHGNPDVLEEMEVPMPTTENPRDIVIKLTATGMNPVDFKVRNGAIPSPANILGYDGVGTVTEVGPEATLFKVGDVVWTAGVLTRNGSNAEFMAVDERIVGKAPESVSNCQAAAVPLVLLTAWEGLFEGLFLKAMDPANVGKTILILPGAGGVGSFVIQLAKHLCGLTVIATASRPESEKAAKDLGADYVINHRKPLKEQLDSIEGIGGSVDYIFNAFDLGSNFDQYCDIIAPLGKIVSICETDRDLPLTKLMAKRVTFTWELMFTRALFGVDPIQQHHILNRGADLVDRGLLVLPSVETHDFNLANLRKVHETQESGSVIGKQTLRM